MEPPFANYFREKTHWILFESEGKVLGHSPRLAKFAGCPSTVLIDAYPILESMVPALLEMPEGEEIVLPCVRVALGGKEGWFDFVFQLVPGAERPTCCLSVMDLSEQYFRLFNMQQTMNQTAIELQRTQREIRPATGGQLSDTAGAQPQLAGMLDRIHSQNSIILDRLQVYLQRDHTKDTESYA